MSELIELLEEQDPDAEVLVMSQPNWPFELSVAGVTTREEMLRADRDEDRDGDDDEEPRLERGTARATSSSSRESSSATARRRRGA